MDYIRCYATNRYIFAEAQSAVECHTLTLPTGVVYYAHVSDTAPFSTVWSSTPVPRGLSVTSAKEAAGQRGAHLLPSSVLI